MKKMLNNSVIVGSIFVLASLLFILIGIRIYCSPETKKENYVRATGIIKTRRMSDAIGRDVDVEFEVNGKKEQANLTFPVGYDFSKKSGDSIAILYCPTKVLFIRTYSIVPDDGVSQQRLIRARHLMGITFIAVGFLLFLPAFLFLKKK